jgi:hypothetical protein
MTKEEAEDLKELTPKEAIELKGMWGTHVSICY